jgi:hypothetical protein
VHRASRLAIATSVALTAATSCQPKHDTASDASAQITVYGGPPPTVDVPVPTMSAMAPRDGGAD